MTIVIRSSSLLESAETVDHFAGIILSGILLPTATSQQMHLIVAPHEKETLSRADVWAEDATVPCQVGS